MLGRWGGIEGDVRNFVDTPIPDGTKCKEARNYRCIGRGAYKEWRCVDMYLSAVLKGWWFYPSIVLVAVPGISFGRDGSGLACRQTWGNKGSCYCLGDGPVCVLEIRTVRRKVPARRFVSNAPK